MVLSTGSKFDLKARNTLAAYKATYGEFYCRHACGECEPQCPYGVPVNTIMRYNHYFMGQGKEKAAMLMYKMLASLTDDEAMHNTFLALSQEEAKHKLRFETEYDEVVLKED